MKYNVTTQFTIEVVGDEVAVTMRCSGSQKEVVTKWPLDFFKDDETKQCRMMAETSVENLKDELLRPHLALMIRTQLEQQAQV